MIITEDTTYHCRTELQLHKFSYTWSIDNFWKTSKFASKLYFNNDEKYFRLCVSFEKDYVKFYAVVNKSDIKDNKAQITVSYSISFKTIEGKVTRISKDMNKWFVNTHYVLLYDLSISYLNDNKQKYLPNETLIIYFEFYICDALVNHNIHYSYHPEIFTQSIPDEKCDSFITFVINEKRLQANKALLCLKSKVFEAMFNCGLKESVNNEVEITDMKYDILQQLLFFLQNGYLSENVKTDTNVASELIIAAEKYDLKDLKLICEEYLITNTTKENVIEHLKFAYLNNATVLKRYVLSLIKLHLRDLMDTPNFITLVQEYHELLLQIQVTEIPIAPATYSV